VFVTNDILNPSGYPRWKYFCLQHVREQGAGVVPAPPNRQDQFGVKNIHR
jgi:hypothetical protein